MNDIDIDAAEDNIMNSNNRMPTRSLVLSAEQLAHLTSVDTNEPRKDELQTVNHANRKMVELDYLNDTGAVEETSYVLGYN